MGIAVLSLSALLAAIIIGLSTRINLGVICVGFAFVIGYFFADMNVADIYTLGFPLKLFFLLLGTTLFAGIGNLNGTYSVLAKQLSNLSDGDERRTCLILFLFSALLSMMGMGTIAAPVILLPLLLEVAKEEDLPELLVILLSISGCIAGGLSLWAPTGSIGRALALQIGVESYSSIFAASFFTFSLYAFILFISFGGLKLKRKPPKSAEPMILNSKQFLTIMVAFGVITAILGFKLDIGLSAFVGAALLLLCKAADESKAIANVPWSTLLLVSGVSILLYVFKANGGLELVESNLMGQMTPETAGACIAFLSGFFSFISSSSAVVMPSLIPTIPSVIDQVGGGVSPKVLVAAVILGAHAVAYSPFSTMGAIGMATASKTSDKQRIFAELLSVAVILWLTTSLLFLLGVYDRV